MNGDARSEIRERRIGKWDQAVLSPAAGYPACPEHNQGEIIRSLLDVEQQTGMKLAGSSVICPTAG